MSWAGRQEKGRFRAEPAVADAPY